MFLDQTNYWFDTTSYEDVVEIKVKSADKLIEIVFPKEKIAPSSVRIFILWITVPSLLLISIAIIFLKNQTKTSSLTLQKQQKDLVKEILLKILDPLELLKLEKQHMNLIEWQKGLIDTLNKDQKCYQE